MEDLGHSQTAFLVKLAKEAHHQPGVLDEAHGQRRWRRRQEFPLAEFDRHTQVLLLHETDLRLRNTGFL